MGAIHTALDTESWLKIEPSGWVRATGWLMLGITAGVLPFRMYPFYWATGLKVTSLMDLAIVGAITLCAAFAAIVLFSQPRAAQAERDAGAVEIERGFLQVQEINVPFGEIKSVKTGAHPLFPFFRRISIHTNGGRRVPFAWSTDAREADEIAGKLQAIIGTPSPSAA